MDTAHTEAMSPPQDKKAYKDDDGLGGHFNSLRCCYPFRDTTGRRFLLEGVILFEVALLDRHVFSND